MVHASQPPAKKWWLTNLKLAVEAESAADAAVAFSEMLSLNGVRQLVIRVTGMNENDGERYYDGYGSEIDLADVAELDGD